jgi:transcriptional regulator with XRE-family HTH domain
MVKQKDVPIGEYVREVRESLGISLRQFAVQIGKTPTFVSRFERDDDVAPSEETLQTIAKALHIDADNLVFRANKVPADLPKIVQQQPVAMAALLRTAQNLTPDQLQKLTEYARKQTEK